MHYNCHTCFSLRYGTLTVDQLLDEAEEKGVDCLALTDINNTSAPLEFVMKARQRGIRPVVGIEFREDNRLRYIGLARNATGFRHLNEFLSAHLHAAATGQALLSTTEGLPLDTLFQPPGTGPGPAEVLPGPDRRLRFPERAPDLPDTFFIYPFEAHPDPATLRPQEFIGVRPIQLNKLFSSPVRNFPDKLLTFTPVTFRNKVGFNTHRLLRAIDRNTILSKQDPRDVAAADEVMLSLEQLLDLYRRQPHLVTNSLRLLEQCAFDMEFAGHKNKLHFTTSQEDDRQLLEKLAWDGFRYRYGRRHAEAEARVRKELEVIHRLGFSAYFLITWDFIRYGQSRGFFHVGRGSGANSIVAYCIGITDVDPIDLDLYFERFLNPHRTSPPDFDIDFSWTDRDDVIDYVFKRYGQGHTSLMATYNTFKGRSIIRELGKVFGLPKEEIDGLVARRHLPQLDDKIVRLIYRYGRELEGMPNHLGIHPGGILISEAPIRSYAATELPPKGFPIVQFDMFVAEDAGLYKYDVLSQRGLGHIRSSFEIVRENRGRTVDVHDVKSFKQDPKIANLLRTGRTVGCFYVESPAMRQLLTKLRCDDYLTLVAASSVIRPGVARSGMMKQYIERHRIFKGISDDRLPISDEVLPAKRIIGNQQSEIAQGWYLHPRMADILAETYGVMVYQEDVIKVAHHFGGVDLGEADILRRAMSGKYRSKNQFQLLREKFFANCQEMGYDESVTAEVWRQMESFSGYSFCKAHSASFAVESYQSLFFKAHYPIEFMVGVVNNFGGFYRTEVYLHEARRAGAEVHLPCVNHSEYLTSLVEKDIWLGYVHLQGFERKLAEAIVQERQAHGPFVNLKDLLRRTPMGLEAAMILIRIGALRFTGQSKKRLLWEVNMHFSKAPARKQTTALFAPDAPDWSLPDLPDDPIEDLYDQIELLGFPMENFQFPISDFQLVKVAGGIDNFQLEIENSIAVVPPIFQLLARPLGKDEVTADQFPARIGQRVIISGYLICTKQVRTVKGDIMGFSDFIDVKGEFFDATLFPDTLRKFPLTGVGIYRIAGRVANDFGVPSIEVEALERLGYRGDPRRE
ncbi:MAG: DNA polymerase III subunit alpha [Bacteroidota bacterium]